MSTTRRVVGAPLTTVRRSVAVALIVGLALIGPFGGDPAPAQTTPTAEQQVPTQDIVPRPDSGAAPEEAGDRGGALQLLLPLLILVAIGGGVWHVSRQARQSRRPADR
jgi:hypothetical protein